VTDGFWALPGVRDGLFAHLDLFKGNLGLGRLSHFIALAYFGRTDAGPRRLSGPGSGANCSGSGRYSLPIFALGSILACAGQAVMQRRRRKFRIGAAHNRTCLHIIWHTRVNSCSLGTSNGINSLCMAKKRQDPKNSAFRPGWWAAFMLGYALCSFETGAGDEPGLPGKAGGLRG